MGDKPKVVVFCCNWSVYPGLQLTELDPSLKRDEIEPIVTICSWRPGGAPRGFQPLNVPATATRSVAVRDKP